MIDAYVDGLCVDVRDDVQRFVLEATLQVERSRVNWSGSSLLACALGHVMARQTISQTHTHTHGDLWAHLACDVTRCARPLWWPILGTMLARWSHLGRYVRVAWRCAGPSGPFLTAAVAAVGQVVRCGRTIVSATDFGVGFLTPFLGSILDLFATPILEAYKLSKSTLRRTLLSWLPTAFASLTKKKVCTKNCLLLPSPSSVGQP